MVGMVAALLLVGAGGARAANAPFMYGGSPIHPGCVHSIVMRSGDRIPVTTAVSVEGCAASDRAAAEVKRDRQNREVLYIEDEALLGEGSFGYRVAATLENGVYILIILRTDGDGITTASLAAVDLVERPALRKGQVVKQKVLEMIGEVWIDNIDAANLRTLGNKVQFTDGFGTSRVERTIDLSRITRASRN